MPFWNVAAAVMLAFDNTGSGLLFTVLHLKSSENVKFLHDLFSSKISPVLSCLGLFDSV